jgi:lysozyme
MKFSDNAVNLIKQFEGCKLQSYKDSVSVWTIGFGSTDCVSENMHISQEQAEAFLRRDMIKFETDVNNLVTSPLNQNQFDALVAFTYNLGAGALERSTLLKLLNQKNYISAANEILKFDHAGHVKLPGLTRRRRAEFDLFVKEV